MPTLLQVRAQEYHNTTTHPLKTTNALMTAQPKGSQVDIFTSDESLSAASKYPITKLPETPISAPTRTHTIGIRRTRRRLAFAGLRKRERRKGGWVGALALALALAWTLAWTLA